MKNILIAATIVGAAAAALILFTSRKNKGSKNEIKDAAKDAYNTMNAGIGKIERLGQHSMG